MKNCFSIILIFTSVIIFSRENFAQTSSAADVSQECMRSIGSNATIQNKATCDWVYESIMTQVHISTLIAYGLKSDHGIELDVVFNNKFVVAELVYPSPLGIPPQTLARVGLPTVKKNNYFVGTTALIHFSDKEVMSMHDMFTGMLRFANGQKELKVFSLLPKDQIEMKSDEDAKHLFSKITQGLGTLCLKAADYYGGHILINSDETADKGFRVDFYKGTVPGFNESKCLDVSPGYFK